MIPFEESRFVSRHPLKTSRKSRREDYPAASKSLKITARPGNVGRAGGGSDEFVDEVLQKLLATADVAGHFAFLEHVGFEVGEIALAGLDFRADARIP